ncbi:MAG: hypothetical protein R3B54_18060 [Bdellovibrionota bacterium]
MRLVFLTVICLSFMSCNKLGLSSGEQVPRLVMFIGADISGSFLKSKNFEDSLDFTAHYLHAHLNGLGGLEKPHALFVGSIGGDKPNEPKTLFPIETFENESVDGIRKKLANIFPKNKSNPFTDYNAFFRQIEATVKSRKLVLKPISVVMISDGKPDVPGSRGEKGFRSINLKPLELLSRSVTVRLLYTDAVVGMGWQTKVPRQRVKVWTQDAAVMKGWKDPKTFRRGLAFSKQERFFDWVLNNVDFNVRAQTVN